MVNQCGESLSAILYAELHYSVMTHDVAISLADLSTSMYLRYSSIANTRPISVMYQAVLTPVLVF